MMSSFRGRSEAVDVCRRTSGRLWTRKTTPPSDGKALEVVHTIHSKASLPNPQLVRFLQIAFDESGSRLLAADLQGTVFVLNLAANSFSRVICFGSACTAVAFSRRSVDEVLVANADASLKIINVETKEVVACLKGHIDPVQTISVHHSGRYVVTSSEDTAQLWDLDTLERKRKLTVKNSPGVLKVFFIPRTNDILTCFRDDSIFCWDAESLTCKFQLPSTSGPGEASAMLRDVATDDDGRHLVAGGRSNRLDVFSLRSKTLLRVVQMPSRLVTSVKTVLFVPTSLSSTTASSSSSSSSSLVIVLSHSGSLLLVDIESLKVVVIFDASSSSASTSEEERIKEVAISPTGRHLVVATDRIKLFLFDKLLSSSTPKPRASKVKVPRSATATGSKCKGRRLTLASKHVAVSLTASNGRRKREEELDIAAAEPLTPAKLKHILATFGQFPSKYRLFIWRLILRLPENHQAFASLVDKGTHPAFKDLNENYPVKDQRLFRALQKTLSYLAHWAPICGESSIIPLIAFPFVKLFVHNQLLCFEVVASVIVNHLQHFFEFFPNPPVNVLAACENLLCFHEPTLLEHFATNGVTAALYAWPPLETLFSEILTANDWLTFFDFVLTSHPSFLLFAVVAFSILNKTALTACNYKDDFRFFFRHHSAISVESLVSLTERLSSSTPINIHPAKNGFFSSYEPLPTGQYPIINGYPEMIVNYRIREKDRLTKENEEVERQEGIVRDINRRAAARHIKDSSLCLPKETHLAEESELRRILRLGNSASAAEVQRRQIQVAMEDVQRKERRMLDATRKKLLLAGPSSLCDDDNKENQDSQTELKQFHLETKDENEENSRDADVLAPTAAAAATPIDRTTTTPVGAAAFSTFDRPGRETFEARERDLMRHIQSLRAKLATSSASSSRTRFATKTTPQPEVDADWAASPPLGLATAERDGGGDGDSLNVGFQSHSKVPFTSPFTLLGGGDGADS